MVNEHLIEKFRAKVNSSDFVYFSYKNKKGKNQWSCICSAMDWITVAVQYINSFDKRKKYIQSMEMFSYIASIDIVWEAIQQLHRVFYETKEIPFKDERKCFKNNKFSECDNEYFKTIRACFGAHPINLNDPINSKAKRYASWSGGHFGEGDYSVILYSNQPNEKHICLSIRFDELDEFLKRRYEHLNMLIEIIDMQNKQFKSNVSKKVIKKSDDILEQLDILKEESKIRMDNESYKNTIDQLIRIYQTPITCEYNLRMVEKYLEALKPLIDEIYTNLSTCNICDLNDGILDQKSNELSEGDNYWVEKLWEYECGAGYDPAYWLNKIKELFKGKFVFEFNNYEELFILVQAYIYQTNNPPSN